MWHRILAGSISLLHRVITQIGYITRVKARKSLYLHIRRLNLHNIAAICRIGMLCQSYMTRPYLVSKPRILVSRFQKLTPCLMELRAWKAIQIFSLSPELIHAHRLPTTYHLVTRPLSFPVIFTNFVSPLLQGYKQLKLSQDSKFAGQTGLCPFSYHHYHSNLYTLQELLEFTSQHHLQLSYLTDDLLLLLVWEFLGPGDIMYISDMLGTKAVSLGSARRRKRTIAVPESPL